MLLHCRSNNWLPVSDTGKNHANREAKNRIDKGMSIVKKFFAAVLLSTCTTIAVAQDTSTTYYQPPRPPEPISYETQSVVQSEVGTPPQTVLSEEDVRNIVADYLASQEAEKEACLTPKERKERDLQMTAKWNDGLELSTKDKKFRTHIGGRTQFDTAYFDVPQNVNQNINAPYGDGVDFRRARFRIDGTLYEVHEFAAEYDFMNSVRVRNQPPGTTTFFDSTVPAVTDLWWQIKEVPIVGNVKIGSQKEPIGFEHMVSSRFQPFMERSYNQDTFYGGQFNGFQPGITIFDNYGADQNGVWHLGLFKPTNNVFGSSTGDGDFAASGRLTNLLYYANDGAELLHVGISGRQATTISSSENVGSTITYRTRDAIRSGLSADWPVPAGITLLAMTFKQSTANWWEFMDR
jgi:phosphate-selective porin OprO/OprP